MNMEEKTKEKSYIAIDLKSYYASVECVDMGRDPLSTNLVVADKSRTEKTICLAVSPSLKVYGIPGRARLFEVVQKVKEVNNSRLARINRDHFDYYSDDANVINANPLVGIDYITAIPRMKRYMEKSSEIFNMYMQFISPQDIHVYSVDECFLDVTDYLKLYNMSARELCASMIKEVFEKTGITATGGVGTNMYLCKIAMDIEAKHIPADENGVRVAELNERSYREKMWTHEPITDFWRVGSGIAKRLNKLQIYTMGDIARCSIGLPPLSNRKEEYEHPSDYRNEKIELGLDGRVKNKDSFYNEELLYKEFGVNAELLIDHAWGYEPTTIEMIKSYVPENNSLSTGQVLSHPYDYDKTKVIVREMTDLLVLDLVEKGLVCDQLVINIGYDIENKGYMGESTHDRYGRRVPKPAHGSINLGRKSSSTFLIVNKALELFDQIIDKNLYVRRLSIAANHVIRECDIKEEDSYEQLDLFTDYSQKKEERKAQEEKDRQEKNLQKAMISIHKKYGKNAVLKGTNFMEGSTAIERNGQVGGHKG